MVRGALSISPAGDLVLASEVNTRPRLKSSLLDGNAEPLIRPPQPPGSRCTPIVAAICSTASYKWVRAKCDSSKYPLDESMGSIHRRQSLIAHSARQLFAVHII